MAKFKINDEVIYTQRTRTGKIFGTITKIVTVNYDTFYVMYAPINKTSYSVFETALEPYVKVSKKDLL